MSLTLSANATFASELLLPPYTAKVGKTSLIMSLVSEEFPDVV